MITATKAMAVELAPFGMMEVVAYEDRQFG